VFDNLIYQTVPDREQFRDSHDAFFAAYAKAHKKLSELGAKFE
jgi:L-ascorbate peroxidase